MDKEQHNDTKFNINDIELEVKKIISNKLGIDIKNIATTSNFIDDLGADSLDTVELVMEFEKKFQVTVSEDIIESIKTVGDIIDYIEKRAKNDTKNN